MLSRSLVPQCNGSDLRRLLPLLACRDNVTELGEFFHEIFITLVLNSSLTGLFAIPTKDAIHNLHSTNDFSNRTKALLVEKGISLGVCVDE